MLRFLLHEPLDVLVRLLSPAAAFPKGHGLNMVSVWGSNVSVVALWQKTPREDRIRGASVRGKQATNGAVTLRGPRVCSFSLFLINVCFLHLYITKD